MKRFFNNIVVKFILITLVFFIITSPIVVLFGPFGNLKRAVVGARGIRSTSHGFTIRRS